MVRPVRSCPGAAASLVRSRVRVVATSLLLAPALIGLTGASPEPLPAQEVVLDKVDATFDPVANPTSLPGSQGSLGQPSSRARPRNPFFRSGRRPCRPVWVGDVGEGLASSRVEGIIENCKLN